MKTLQVRQSSSLSVAETDELLDPAYSGLLGEDTAIALARNSSGFDFPTTIEAIARRMGAIRSGGVLDLSRAAQHTIRWWREGNHAKGSSSRADASNSPSPPPSTVRGWGLDFYFGGDEISNRRTRSHTPVTPDGASSGEIEYDDAVQTAMNAGIDRFLDGLREKANGVGISANQQKKKEREDKQKERERNRAMKRSQSV